MPDYDKLTEEQVKALADIGARLKQAAEELYPGVHWGSWTPEMWDKIWEKAEAQWQQDQSIQNTSPS